MKIQNKIQYTFFGSSRFSINVLDEMQKLGYVPKLIVTIPDKPQGRKLALTPNVVKTWAIEHQVPCYDFTKLKDEAVEQIRAIQSEVFIVASYGKILPKDILEVPKHGILNIHPSLLPKYRGASPLPTAMLDDTKDTGVTIMKIDEEMDHGPIVAQKRIHVQEWPIYEDFEKMMVRAGAQLLVSILPEWVAGAITAKVQDHASATYTRKYVKTDGEIDMSADPYVNFRKIQAFHEWPQAYFFAKKKGKNIRVKITDASYANGQLIIKKVIPEGSREMSYADFKIGYTHT